MDTGRNAVVEPGYSTAARMEFCRTIATNPRHMNQIAYCLLALLFSVSSLATEGNARIWQSTLAAKTGRLGNQATRQHVADVATEMESRGWNITHGGGRFPEEYLPGPGGGRLGSSFPDITATKNGRTLRVNTIDTRANGITPTTREAANAARIRSQTPGDHLLLVPKP